MRYLLEYEELKSTMQMILKLRSSLKRTHIYKAVTK